MDRSIIHHTNRTYLICANIILRIHSLHYIKFYPHSNNQNAPSSLELVLSPLASLASPRSSAGGAHVQPGAGLPQPGCVTSASVPSMLDSWSVLEYHTGPLRLYVKLPHLQLSFLFYRCLLRSSLYFVEPVLLVFSNDTARLSLHLHACKRLYIPSQCKP